MYSSGDKMEYAGSGVVTRQGQITVPKKVRKTLGIEIGTVLEFYFNDEMMMVRQRSSPPETFTMIADNARKRFKARGITKKDVEEEIKASRRR